MNAFLIFCKRHRTVVRKCYPNLENRAITKILGDWWSQLDNTEKESYIQLAQQYKEAFLKAFPDFKWYKLPAPPLRTLVTRPSNHSKPHKLECHLTCGPIVPGKLADESQMGRLSTLILSSASATATTAAGQSTAGSPPASPPAVPKPPKKRYLQGLFDAACAGEPAAEGQELASPPEKHISEWNGQQFTFGNLPSSMMSSHCPNFTTLPLTALHSPRDDASDHSPCTPQGASCGGGTRTVSSIVWSSNTDSPATGTAPGDSETTFHTSKQVIIDFVVDKLVNKEPCFQVRSSYISTSSGSSVITSESFAAASDRDSLAEELLSSDTRRCGVTSALQFESAPSVVSLPPLTGVPGSFVPPHTTTRRDSVVNSFCSQPVSYVTAPSSGTEIVTWAQDINVSRIVASLTNNNFYINKGKNGSLAVENIDGSPSSDCGLADCIPNNSSEHPFSVECPEASETSSGPFLINYKVFDAASLKTGCENALISFTGYSSEDCVVTSSGCDDSKTISCLPFSKEPKLPQSDLSVKFSSNRLEAETCDEDGEKNLSVPVKIVHVDEAIKCPVTSGGYVGKESTVYSNNLCSSSCGDSRQVQISATATVADKCSDDDTTVKTKPANTHESSVVKMFPLKEHLRRYKAEQNCGDDSETVLTSAAIVSQSRLLPFPNVSTEPCPKQTAPCFLSSLEHASQVGVQTNPPATSGANVAAYSFKSSTSSKKSEDFANVGGKPALLPQRQTSVRACKGQRYKQFMKETSRGVNKRARKAVLGTVEGGTVVPSPRRETLHQQQACREAAAAGEASSADPRGPWDAAPAGGEAAPSAALPWHAPLPGSPRRERLDSASSCCSSERTFSACSEGSLDALPPLAPVASVAGCSSFSQATSPIEKKKRKFSESLLQQDLATDGATKRDCETFDFNLDEKIGALPPLSLEDFQIKKKNRKRRCFAVLKTSTTTSETAASHSTMCTVTAIVPSSTPSVTREGTAVVPDHIPGEHPLMKRPEADETAAEDPVGSQKRKARRNSIRRLDADRTEGERVGADLWIGLLLLADAATSRSKMAVPGCSRGTDVSVVSHAPTSLS
ncbi:uncharacterized protein LOC134539200 [Bacillus rossius redtenbacheri]|uniref:uncharacterized protein LOC134539200 n=1 Tax=Bacillus rossius redtenbacheri TaxID=93214 RepID=UPI002FDC9626